MRSLLSVLLLPFVIVSVSFADFDPELMQGGEIQFDLSSSGTTQRLLVYPELEFYRVDRVELSKDKLPDLVERTRFTTKEKAIAFVEANFPNAVIRMQKKFDAELSIEFRTEARGVIWTAEHEWDWHWEQRYSEWLATLSTTYLKDHNVATDCADVAYAYRWIFARIHKLPAGNRLAGSNVLLTNESMRSSWRNLPTHNDWHQDRRFLAALDYLLDLTYTHSLFRDMYPIAIQPEAFLGGTVHLGLSGSSGHTQVVTKTFYNDDQRMPIFGHMSTVPRQVREMMGTEFTFIGNSQADQTAFLRHRWVSKQSGSWRMTATRSMPHFSEEQFAPDFQGGESSFTLALLKRLNPNFQPEARVESGVAALRLQVEERKAIVRDGYAYCSQNDCSEGTAAYENWSTPSRDKRLRNTISEVLNYIASVASVAPGIIEIWNNFLLSETEILGEVTQLRSVVFANRTGFMSYDPNDTEELRWTVKPEFVVSRLAAFLTKGFQERSALVRRGRDSTDIDRRYLRMTYGAAQSYCGETSAANCRDYHSLIVSSSIQFAGETRTIKEWLGKIPAMSSNASVSTAQRWGELANWNYQDVSPVQSISYSQAGYVYVDDGFLPRFLQVQAGSSPIEVSFPAGFSVQSLSPSSPLVFGQFNDKAAIYSLAEQRISYINEAWTENIGVGWIPGGYFMRYDQAASTTALYRWENGGAVLKREFPKPPEGTLGRTAMLAGTNFLIQESFAGGVFEAKLFELNDLDSPILFKRYENLPNNVSPSIQFIEKQDENKYLLNFYYYHCRPAVQQCDDYTRHFVFDRSTGASRNVFTTDVLRIQRVRPYLNRNIVLVQRQNGLDLVEMSDDYRILRELRSWRGQFWLQLTAYDAPGYFTLIDFQQFGNQYRYYFTEDGSLIERHYTVEGIVGGLGPFMSVWSNQSEGTVIRDFMTEQDIFEGKKAFLFPLGPEDYWLNLVREVEVPGDEFKYFDTSLYSLSESMDEALFQFSSGAVRPEVAQLLNPNQMSYWGSSDSNANEKDSPVKILRIWPSNGILIWPK